MRRSLFILGLFGFSALFCAVDADFLQRADELQGSSVALVQCDVATEEVFACVGAADEWGSLLACGECMIGCVGQSYGSEEPDEGNNPVLNEALDEDALD